MNQQHEPTADEDDDQCSNLDHDHGDDYGDDHGDDDHRYDAVGIIILLLTDDNNDASFRD